MALYKEKLVFIRTPDQFPKTLQIVEGSDLADFESNTRSRGGPLISKAMQAVIERHEKPGNGMQFQPVTIVDAKGDRFSDDYVFWDIYRRVDAIDPTGEIYTVDGGSADGRHAWVPTGIRTKESAARDRDVLRVFKSQFEGMCAWVDFRYGSRVDPPIFISDALYTDLLDAQMKGIAHESEWAEV